MNPETRYDQSQAQARSDFPVPENMARLGLRQEAA